jgi:hypothetical protein
VADNFRTLYCDPGEDFGWCVGVDFKLISRGITKMWETVHEVADDLENLLLSPADHRATIFNNCDSGYAIDDVDPDLFRLPVGRIVCEDFRIYPWKAKSLTFNPVRTARAIGALTYLAQRHGIPFVLQPAAIKKAAVAAGAEELFDSPRHENRHSNDAIMHFTYFTATELRGISIPVPNEGVQGQDDGGVDD